MNKFWQWMIAKRFEVCFVEAIGSPVYPDEIASASPQTIIGYMIQYLMEETDTNNIEIVKDNFSVDSMYELIVKAIEEKK